MTMYKGKTVKIFFLDEGPDGRKQCELSNWTGKAYRIPRKYVKNSADRPDLERPGVYILFGRTEDNHEVAYIGQGEKVRGRLKDHIKEKDFWNEALVFISKDDNLNKAHVRYLEKRLYDIAQKTGRFTINNPNCPGGSAIGETEQAEMEEFIENLKILTSALGFRIFEDLIDKTRSKNEERKDTFYIKAARGADGQGERIPEGFIVFKGSSIADPVTASFPPHLLNLRNNLIINKVITNNKFADNYPFNSSSTAASIIMGRAANGLTEWKLKDGKKLKTVESGE